MKFAMKLPKLPSRSAAKAPVEKAADGESLLSQMLDRKRLMRVAILLLIAGSAGQIMKFNQTRDAAQRSAAAAEVQAEPKQIVALSGEATPKLAPIEQPEQAAAAVTAAAAPEAAPKAEAPPDEVVVASAAAVAVNPGAKTITPPQTQATLVAATPEAAQPLPESAEVAQTDCPVTLDLAEVPGALIGVTYLAPCAPNARVVLQHEGLSVTGVTTASGALFASLPALVLAATVQAVQADGSMVEAQLTVPAAADFRRFGVQWQGDDAFQVNAYEDGAAFGTLGHVNGVQTGLVSDAGGFLQILGDPSAPMPLLAEIYTYPAGETPVELVVESAVTDKTCGRELLAETITAQGGNAFVTDLTLAMPDCGAIGDFLVLNNLALDMTLAAN